MNPWPQERSILVLDNCRIHKSKMLRRAVEAAGASCRVCQWLPCTDMCQAAAWSSYPRIPRSSTPSRRALPPVSTAAVRCLRRISSLTDKAYLRRHYRRLQQSDTPILDLYAAADAITSEKARAWIAHAGYPDS